MVLHAICPTSFKVRQDFVPKVQPGDHIIVLGETSRGKNHGMPVGIYLLPDGTVGFCQDPSWLIDHDFVRKA